ncbi:patatin-like phospholipase family protein [Micromonospora sp. CPCC 206061]|uniref:patatin-like phospholipase family protein n=1 Tax=Micromonospora sp. CPCC 206061 TaxID=3122410 RepID=UPI002FF2C378
MRALVLGGGGVTGVAWELGVLAGLADAGVDLLDADVFVGTSAGSVVAAQVTSGVPLEELYSRQLGGPGAEIAARIGLRTLVAGGFAMLGARDELAFRRRLGRMALAAPTGPAAERIAVIASRLPAHTWPDRRLLVTAVDADTGEFVVFDRDGGVSLVEAVAASCAVPGVWAPVPIGERRFIDGGMRSAANADVVTDAVLAGALYVRADPEASKAPPSHAPPGASLSPGGAGPGFDQVVVIAPIARGGGRIARLSDQVAALRRTARVAVVTPDRAARRAIGRNVLDPARRAPAARAGRVQAIAAAEQIARVWTP